ncbi:Mediator of RNA polymerase II transcription subunit 6, variant 2 [Entomophthora muscae]|nr:Mediator of RNA polymerase II transcription subunit 6, variant 2 [Entomophthora muscae]
MIGIEFELVKEQYPILYIIQKQRRRSPTEAIPMAVYYIINGNIYQAPDLYSVLANRMLTIVNHLNRAFREVYNYVEFHPSSGYRWKFNLPKVEEAEKKSQDTAIQRAIEFKNSIDRVFFNEMSSKNEEKKAAAPAEHPALVKLSSAQEVLNRVSPDSQKLISANTSVSTPSSNDGGKLKRKSEKDGTKKKKKVKTETPQA